MDENKSNCVNGINRIQRLKERETERVNDCVLECHQVQRIFTSVINRFAGPSLQFVHSYTQSECLPKTYDWESH